MGFITVIVKHNSISQANKYSTTYFLTNMYSEHTRHRYSNQWLRKNELYEPPRLYSKCYKHQQPLYNEKASTMNNLPKTHITILKRKLQQKKYDSLDCVFKKSSSKLELRIHDKTRLQPPPVIAVYNELLHANNSSETVFDQTKALYPCSSLKLVQL